MGFKLLLLVILGVGALYLLHLLAQDYMKIRKPAAKLAKFLLSKRDVEAVESRLAENEIKDFNIDWDRILKNDQFKCAQLLICQIMTGAENDNHDAITIRYLVEYAVTVGLPKEIEVAYSLGMYSSQPFEKCNEKYKFCPYSTRTMLKMLQWYDYLFG